MCKIAHLALTYLITHSCLRQVGGFLLTFLAPTLKPTATTELKYC